jgi:large subunit ribosomal protein L35
MPKIKTNRSAAKRFKRTGSGKLVYHKAFGSHILSSKTRKRKRALRKSPIVNRSNMRALKLLLPNG